MTAAAETPFEGTSSFAPESYDAMALILLAMHAAGSANSADWTQRVEEIANGPGEEILPATLPARWS
jgi:branched-chain amino acid transport system substrate-binding protein